MAEEGNTQVGGKELIDLYPRVGAALAPISKHMESLPVKTLGVRRFVNMRDLKFVMENKDKPFMSQHKAYIDNLTLKLYASILLVPLSLFANIKLQRTFPKTFGSKHPLSFLLDIAWFSATAYAMILLNEQAPKEKRFQEIKDSLLAQHNSQYLLHLYNNWKKYRLPFSQQIGDRAFNDAQLDNMKFLAEKAMAEQKAKSRKVGNKADLTK